MGLFSHKHEQPPVQTAPVRTSASSPNSKGGLFHRRSDPEPVPVQQSTNGGLFHRNHLDPSIVQAKQRIADAEAAERNADRALVQARAAVRDARADIKRLEREAAEEARLAKIKQHQAAGISKSAKHLGRHGVN